MRTTIWTSSCRLLVDEDEDRPDHRGILSTKDPKGHAGVPRRPLLLQPGGSLLVGTALVGTVLVDHHRDGNDVVTEREGFGHGTFGQPRDVGDRNDHLGRLSRRRSGPETDAQLLACRSVVLLDAEEQEDERVG